MQSTLHNNHLIWKKHQASQEYIRVKIRSESRSEEVQTIGIGPKRTATGALLQLMCNLGKKNVIKIKFDFIHTVVLELLNNQTIIFLNPLNLSILIN